MSSLKYLIDSVGNILDYNPEVPEYREQIRDLINETYISLFLDASWPFAQKEIKLKAFADVSLPVDAEAGNVCQIYNDYNGPLGAGAGTYYCYLETSESSIPSWVCAGCVIRITGGTLSTSGDPLSGLNQDYWITNIVNVAPSKINIYFQRMDKDSQRRTSVAERTPKIGVSGTDVTAVISQPYLVLPEDCTGLISIGLREGSGTSPVLIQDFNSLPKLMDEVYQLDKDIVGVPTTYIRESEWRIPAPIVQPTATVNAGAAIGLRAPYDGDYDVCYTFIKAQRNTSSGPAEDESIISFESAPSPISDSVVLATATTDGITIGNMQKTDISDGLYKRYYVRCPESGRFYSTGEYPANHSTTGKSIELYPEFLSSAKSLPECGGVYQRIRLFPRQDDDYILTIRYSFRPQRLIDDSDCLEGDSSIAKYIIFKAASEAFGKHNNQTSMSLYSEKAEKERANLKRKYLTQKGSWNIKKPFYDNGPYSPFRKLTKVG